MYIKSVEAQCLLVGVLGWCLRRCRLRHLTEAQGFQFKYMEIARAGSIGTSISKTAALGKCSRAEMFTESGYPQAENQISTYTRALGDEPRHFERWSSDENDTRVGTHSPNYHTTPYQLEDVWALHSFNVHRSSTRRVLRCTGLELATSQP
ncbi:hypothetical protein TNCV_3077841 [Trichonephila clavipes]|nr:hypothetical protein TNCV_3077841 [Trichonephila clavipes]